MEDTDHVRTLATTPDSPNVLATSMGPDGGRESDGPGSSATL